MSFESIWYWRCKQEVFELEVLGNFGSKKSHNKNQKDFELYRVFMHNFLGQTVPIFPIYILLTRRINYKKDKNVPIPPQYLFWLKLKAFYQFSCYGLYYFPPLPNNSCQLPDFVFMNQKWLYFFGCHDTGINSLMISFYMVCAVYTMLYV